MASRLKPTVAGGRGLDVVTDPRGAPNCRFYVSLFASYGLHGPRPHVVVEVVVVCPGDDWL